MKTTVLALTALAFSAFGGASKFAQWETAFCGSDLSAINTAKAEAAAFNEGGDSGLFTPGTSADAKHARSIADTCFWDLPAGP